jgi:hypothetical protein
MGKSGRGIPDRIRTCGLRFRNRSEENREALQGKDLQPAADAAYRPAYREIPDDLAHVVAVWHTLPEHVRQTISTLVKATPPVEKDQDASPVD